MSWFFQKWCWLLRKQLGFVNHFVAASVLAMAALPAGCDERELERKKGI
jgi:hypothetical protein